MVTQLVGKAKTGTMPGIPLIALSQASTDHRQVCWQTARMRTCAPRRLSRIAFGFDKLHIMCYLRNIQPKACLAMQSVPV